MKLIKQTPNPLHHAATLLLTLLLVASCAEQLPNWPVPLDTPEAETITIDATDKTTLVVSWPAVEDAAAYEFSLYKVDEKGANPVAVGIEKEAITGTTARRPQEPSTYYKIVLKTLGDQKNRANAQRFAERLWNNIPILLQTPPANQLTIDAEDPAKLLITWPAVSGAKGFEFTLYKVDPSGENPVAVGPEKELITGTSAERPQDPASFYKIALQVLGDPEQNTLDGQLVERLWNNLPAGTLPTGTNLTEHLLANPITGDEEVTILLAPYGLYTMTGNIALGTTPVILRGQSKDAPATITITDGSFVNSGAALRLENLELDYTNFLTEKDGENNLTHNALILMSPHPEGATLTSNGFLLLPETAPITLQSCKITGLKGYLFSDDANSETRRYAIETLRIEDCIIGMNTGTWGNATIRFQSSIVRNFTLTKSTIYNEVAPAATNNRFMQFNSTSYASQIEGWTGGSMTIINNTFWQAGKGSHSFNSNGPMGRAEDLVTVQKNIFVDSFENGNAINRFRRGNTTAQFVGGWNTQWYDGANFSGGSDATRDPDNRIETDPGLTYLGNGVFTLSGPDQISAATGDPRWLP
jgi:hypothetical protein